MFILLNLCKVHSGSLTDTFSLMSSTYKWDFSTLIRSSKNQHIFGKPTQPQPPNIWIVFVHKGSLLKRTHMKVDNFYMENE